jgi:hypothetical protein
VRSLLTALGTHRAGPYIRYIDGEAASAADVPHDAPPAAAHGPRGVLLGLVEEVLAAELPLLHADLLAAGVPTALPAARWLDTSWLNFVPWPSLVCAALLPLLLGAEWAVYLCVAAMRHVGAAHAAHAAPAALALRMLLPLEGFDALALVPYMLELRRRHGARCQAALASHP